MIELPRSLHSVHDNLEDTQFREAPNASSIWICVSEAPASRAALARLYTPRDRSTNAFLASACGDVAMVAMLE